MTIAHSVVLMKCDETQVVAFYAVYVYCRANVFKRDNHV